jgi:hypothetical protein
MQEDFSKNNVSVMYARSFKAEEVDEEQVMASKSEAPGTR